MSDAIRVLVVDDSAVYREVIARVLGAQPDVQVVGTARNGQEAVAKAVELRPDVITLDVEMPVMDGLTALAALMQRVPSRVIMLSRLTSQGTREAVRALCLGALECIAKPSGQAGLVELEQQLVAKVRMVMQAQAPARRRFLESSARPTATRRQGRARHLVVIGASTGGPAALEAVLSQLDEQLPAAVLLVQHMPQGFTASLAQRLDRACSLPVVEANWTDSLVEGRVYLARGGTHLEVHTKEELHSVDGATRHGVKPAVDVTLASAAEHFGPSTTAVILTGMGRDGTEGAGQVRKAGGQVIAQDEATSVIYGMPRAVVEAGLAQRVLPLRCIAAALNRLA